MIFPPKNFSFVKFQISSESQYKSTVFSSSIIRKNPARLLRMAQVRKWIGTLNNPEVTVKDYLTMYWDTAKFGFITGQLEEG